MFRLEFKLQKEEASRAEAPPLHDDEDAPLDDVVDDADDDGEKEEDGEIVTGVETLSDCE